jgi:hypothetical protein
MQLEEEKKTQPFGRRPRDGHLVRHDRSSADPGPAAGRSGRRGCGALGSSSPSMGSRRCSSSRSCSPNRRRRPDRGSPCDRNSGRGRHRPPTPKPLRGWGAYRCGSVPGLPETPTWSAFATAPKSASRASRAQGRAHPWPAPAADHPRAGVARLSGRLAGGLSLRLAEPPTARSTRAWCENAKRMRLKPSV